jgi:5-methylthioadenosine/S-adenosylhomocysteine deaminase
VVDLLLENAILVTMDPRRRILSDSAVAIEDGRIVDVGDTELLRKKHQAKEVVDASHMAVLPGFINTHVHLYQNLLKGLGDDTALVDWCNATLFPLCRVMHDDSSVHNYDIGYHGALMAMLEMIRSGTTCFVGMDGLNPLICKAMEQTGIRGFHSFELADRWIPKDFQTASPEEQLRSAKNIVKEWHGAQNGRIKCMVGPSAPFCCTKELLVMSREFAFENGLWLNTHLSETQYEVDVIRKETGKRPTEFLHDIGILGPKFLAVHCVWVNEGEINLLRENGVKVSHNPESNMKLGSGVAPVPEMLREGITVAVATDGCGSNDNLDMFEAMRTAALMHKLSTLNPKVISAQKVLEMATVDAARAIGEERELGSIEVGKRADLVLVDLDKPHLQPLHDLVRTLVYCANGADVETVIIDGKMVYERGQIKTVNEEKVIQRTKEVTQNAMLRAKGAPSAGPPTG